MSRKQRETDTHIAVAIPVVPMLDLSFQILFFAICLFNPSKAEGEMNLRLSAKGEAKAKDPADLDLNAAPSKGLEPPAPTIDVVIRYFVEKKSNNFTTANFTVSLRNTNKSVDDIMIDDKNKTIRGLIFDRDPKYQFTPEELEAEKKAREELNIVLDKLRTTLEQKLKEAKEKEANKKEGEKKEVVDELTIEPNAKCKNELLVLIMDRCKQAGYRVDFAAPPDGNQ